MPDLKTQILEYLLTQKLMGIATFGNHPWPAIVYYIHDEDLNIYFLSNPGDLHSKNIVSNPKVACTIFDSSQPNHAKKIGLQIYGTAEPVNIVSRVKWMLGLWNKIIAGEKGKRFDPEAFIQAGTSKIYKITPKKIKFFNQELFPESGFEVLELSD